MDEDYLSLSCLMNSETFLLQRTLTFITTYPWTDAPVWTQLVYKSRWDMAETSLCSVKDSRTSWIWGLENRNTCTTVYNCISGIERTFIQTLFDTHIFMKWEYLRSSSTILTHTAVAPGPRDSPRISTQKIWFNSLWSSSTISTNRLPVLLAGT